MKTTDMKNAVAGQALKKRSVWTEPKIVLPVILASLTLAAISAGFVTSRLPKTYTAKVKLEMSGGSQVRAPGAFAELANDPGFKDLVLRQTKESSESTPGKLRGINFEVKAELLENARMFAIGVEAPTPQSAKYLANAAAKALIKKAADYKPPSVEYTSARIAKALEPVDKDLAELRKELYMLKSDTSTAASVDQKVKEAALNDKIAAKTRERERTPLSTTSTLAPGAEQLDNELAKLREELYNLQRSPAANQPNIDKIVKIDYLQDRISAKLDARRALADLEAKEPLKDLFEAGKLKIVFPADLPRTPSSPSWPRNVGIGVLAGLLVGIVTLSAADFFYQAKQ